MVEKKRTDMEHAFDTGLVHVVGNGGLGATAEYVRKPQFLRLKGKQIAGEVFYPPRKVAPGEVEIVEFDDGEEMLAISAMASAAD